MKEYFYKLAPVILAVTGLLINICGYFIEKYTPGDDHMLLWWVVVLTQTLIAMVLGRLIKQLYKHSNRDSLTGLRNRRYFYKRLAYEMERLRRTSIPISLAIIDIDNFKRINDTYGHNEGDRVLIELSKIFKSNIRVIDTIARWGGEEFTVILPNTNIEGAKIFAERVRNMVEKCNSCYSATVCVGIASTSHKMDVDKFVALADKALYRAKEKKNKVVSMEGSMLIEIANFRK